MARVLSLSLPNPAIDRRLRTSRTHPARPARSAKRSQHHAIGKGREASRSGATVPRPLLLSRREHGRAVVAQACARSQRCGVRAGMSIAHARALLPGDATIEPHDPAADAAALRGLARWAWRFTPIVQVDPPGGLLLEITGCEHLFGGTRAMLRTVTGQIERLGWRVRGAIGPTVGSAWALARFGPAGAIVEHPHDVPEALSPLPIEALRIEPDVVAALRSVAVETIGQLMQLPRASLGERFGPSVSRRLDQALGQAFEPIDPMRPSEPVRIERVFDGPVKQLEAIRQTGDELAAALCDQLAEREAGARQVRLELTRIDAANLHETLTLSRGSREVKHLRTLLRPRLEAVHLGHGIERMALHATATVRLPHRQHSAAQLGGADESADRSDTAAPAIGALVDQLAARFGRQRVTRLAVRPTHVPERVFVHRPADAGLATPRDLSMNHGLNAGDGSSANAGPDGDTAFAPVVDADRPTWLEAQPRPARVMLLSPEGPVMTLQYDGQARRIVRTIGPERITPRWWLVGEPDRTPPPRDYYKVQDEHGQWWWLYRQAGTARWFVHGRWC